MPVAIRDGIEAGEAIYTPAVLSVYDVVVHGLSNHILWRCPTSELCALYDRNVSARHLDVGVGTGYFLNRARWPVENPEIMLVDLNANSLAAAADRIARFTPRAAQANVLEPLPDLGRFCSVGLCYLLHCLPGAMAEKAVVFDNIRPLLEPGARVFGASIVQEAAALNAAARRIMDYYNAKGIFSNRADRVSELEAALATRFEDVRVVLKGTVAIFEARAP
jgi:ubiquinone/menaquinone biosynthesis C-methylase UbiE